MNKKIPALLLLTLSLGAQSATVSEFYQVNREYTQSYIELLEARAENARAQVGQLEEYNRLKAKLEASKKQLSDLEAALLGLRSIQEAIPAERARLQEQLVAAKKAVETAAGQLVALGLFERIEDIDSGAVEGLLKPLKDQLATLEAEKTALTERLAGLQQAEAYKALQKTLQEKTVEAQRLENLIAESVAKIPTIEAEIASLGSQKAGLVAKLTDLRARKKVIVESEKPKIDSQLAETKDKIDNLQAEISVAEARIRQAREEALTEQSSIQTLQKKISRVRRQLNQSEEELRRLSQTISGIESQRQEVESIQSVKLPALKKKKVEETDRLANQKVAVENNIAENRKLTADFRASQLRVQRAERTLKDTSEQLKAFKREVETLNREILAAEPFEQQITDADAKLDAVIAELKVVIAEKEKIEKEMAELPAGSGAEREKLEAKRAKLIVKITEKRSERRRLRIQIDDLSSQVGDLQGKRLRRQTLLGRIEVGSQELAEKETALQLSRSELNSLSQQKEASDTKLRQSKVDLNTIKSNLAGINREINELESRLVQLQSSIADLAEAKARADKLKDVTIPAQKAEFTKLQTEKEAAQSRFQAATEVVTKTETALTEKRSEKLSLEQKRSVLMSESEALTRTVQGLTSEIVATDISLTKTDEKVSAATQQLSEAKESLKNAQASLPTVVAARDKAQADLDNYKVGSIAPIEKRIAEISSEEETIKKKLSDSEKQFADWSTANSTVVQRESDIAELAKKEAETIEKIQAQQALVSDAQGTVAADETAFAQVSEQVDGSNERLELAKQRHQQLEDQNKEVLRNVR